MDECVKRDFNTYAKAARFLRLYRGEHDKNGREQLYVYLCDRGCNTWHLGHTWQKSRPDNRASFWRRYSKVVDSGRERIYESRAYSSKKRRRSERRSPDTSRQSAGSKGKR